MTKREVLEVIGSVFEGSEFDSREEVLEYVAKETAALNHKNEMAKKRAAEKRAKGDDLRNAIEEILSDEPKTIDAILAELNDEALTSSKIVARVSQLVKAEKANKETIKVNGSKKVAYTIA